MTAPAAGDRRRRALLARVRRRLPELPPAALYHLESVLEQALQGRRIDPDLYRELERIAGPARRA